MLVFYGVGGIGKTTLSYELERRFLAAAEADGGPGVAVRVDLAEATATDAEALLLRLRAGLGRLGSRWQAFDLALSCYWSRAHPGEPLGEFLDASPLVRRLAKDVNVGRQVASNVASLVPVELPGVAGAVHRVSASVYRVVRDRIRRGRLLAGCDLLAELIEADADPETLSFFPYLLAWDLDRLPRTRPAVCVFMDSFEAATAAADRAAERVIQRCVYLMPNVLFVLTGRNRIDWADDALGGELDFCGPHRWPNLHFSNHDREPRQHLVGYLSDRDADGYLRAALTCGGEPAIPSGIRRRIVAGAGGLPLYLDLSVSHYVELLARGVEPTFEDFGGSFGAVATRTIRDLAHDERDLVRTAALVERFDAGLLQAGQPRLADGRIARFLGRPFLLRDDAYTLPYTLHGALRMATGDADRTMPDGWSERDRHDTAQRVLAGLGERASGAADRIELVETLEAGLALANDHDIFDDWLAAATEQLVEAGQWSTLEGWLPPDEPANPQLRGLHAAIRGVVLRRTGDAPQAVAVLDRATPLVEPDSKVGQLIGLHLAHALRNTGDYTAAAEIYRRLVDTDLGDVARYWLSDHDYLGGRFQAALDQLESWHGRTPAQEGERLRLVGHIARVNARFEQAAGIYTDAVRLAHDEHLVAAEAKARTNLAQTRCWEGDPAAVNEQADRAGELLDLGPNPVEQVKLLAARAVATILAGDHHTATATIESARRAADGIGYRGGHNLADVASILADARAGHHDRAVATLRDLEQRTVASGGNIYWVPIAAQWLPGAVAGYDEGWHDIDWLDGADTLHRWAEVAVP